MKNENIDSNDDNARRFLEMIRRSRKGRFKLYIGMIAGVGKTYRMLQEARTLIDNGVDVQIGYVETHGRLDTEKMLEGLPVIPRKRIFYKGKELEEMDLDMILQSHPEVVVVDELAHSNVEGSRNRKRWEDVMELLHAGINVISAINIQHFESLKNEIAGISGIDVTERVPDSVMQEADEVVNIDLSAEELIDRLKAGKIYRQEKIPVALNHFFKKENILQLRELALEEVTFRIKRKVETEVLSMSPVYSGKVLACVSSNPHTPSHIIRKAYRLASRYNTQFIALFVQTSKENPDVIPLVDQRHLLNHFKLVTELGGVIRQVESDNVTQTIVDICKEQHITTVCMGTPSFKIPHTLFHIGAYRKFLAELSAMKIDLIIIAS